jgi:hypothetical protein
MGAHHKLNSTCGARTKMDAGYVEIWICRLTDIRIHGRMFQ